MPNPYFRFKQFTLMQDRCAMKVGTDGVLLGAWTNPGHAERILDIGTGTGLLALMMAQKSKALIDAIDIDENACVQASFNAANSPWKERITVHHTPFSRFVKSHPVQFDLIITNPPFFSNSLKPEDTKRLLARHDDSLNAQELLQGVLLKLSLRGLFFLILPFQAGNNFIRLSGENGLHCRRKLLVRPKINQPVKRILMEFSRHPIPCEENTLIIEKEKRHEYTEEYKQITSSFYL